MTIIRYMSTRLLKPLFALAWSMAAVSAAAQTVISVPAPTEGAPATSGAAGSVGAGSVGAPSLGMTPTISANPGLSAAPSIQASPAALAPAGQAAAAPAMAAAAGVPASAAPGFAAQRAPSAGPAASIPAPGVAIPGQMDPAFSRAAASNPNSNPGAAAALNGSPRAAALSGALSGTARPGSAPASAAAGAALDGTARKISEAKLAESAGGDDLSVSRALDKAFDAQNGGAALRSGAPGVAGRAQGLREAVAQKIAIANSAPPSDAPGLYLDVIQTVKNALPDDAAAAARVTGVVERFAARKADGSLGDLANSALTAASQGSARETARQVGAFDKWESLLGAPGRPLISNLDALKGAVTDLLRSAQSGSGRSAPHVWFERKDGAYAAVLPGSGVVAIPALAAAFAISPKALAPETALSDAYRAFAADPRAATGAGLVYRARRTLGATVPGAALDAARFWLRAALEALWRRFVALFSGRASYELSRKSGQDELRRDAGLAETARAEAAAARRLLSARRLTVAETRAAFAALARSAEAYRALSGDGAASAAVASLSRGFDSAAALKSLRPSDDVPPGLSELVTGPGAVAHWAERLETEASRAVDARFWRGNSSAAFVNLGAANSSAAAAATAAQSLAGVPLSTVALDDRFWTRGRGPNGEARAAAELRGTASGGFVELTVERGDAALARRLEDMGLTVLRSGNGLRAVAGPEDFAYGAEELGPLAARALAAALGRTEADAGSTLRALAAETRRDPASAAKLAALLDGREVFARAPVIGLVGDYEALAPMSVVVDGKPLLVSALRDPDTGLLAYARAARPDGAPLGAAELRALLTRGR
jgi:hypothetical protein